MSTKDNKFVCTDCFRLKKCKEPAISWLFFFVAIIAAISIRAVNVVLSINPVLAKLFWYIGVSGFFIFFIYKYRNYNILHRELERTKMVDKLLNKDKLSSDDYEVLGTVLCSLRSKKDKINYFIIFFFSGIALALAIYADFFR